MEKTVLGRLSESVLSGLERDDLYLVRKPPELLIGERHIETMLELEEDRLDSAQSVARLVEISRLVDAIQNGGSTYLPPGQSKGFVSDAMKSIIANVEFKPHPLSPAKRMRYERSLSKLYQEPSAEKAFKNSDYEEFTRIRSQLALERIREHELRSRIQTESDPDRLVELSGELARQTELIDNLQSAIRALDTQHGFGDAEDEITDAERAIDSIPPSVQESLDMLGVSKISDPISGTSHVLGEFMPDSIAESNWTDIHFGQADFREFDIEDFRHIESIDAQVQTLVVERAWLWESLFHNPNWGWRAPSDEVSDGAGADDAGLLPAYVHSLVFIRGLTVRLRPDAKTSTVKASSMPIAKRPFLAQALIPTAVRLKALKKPSNGIEAAVATVEPRLRHRASLVAARRIPSAFPTRRLLAAGPSAPGAASRPFLATATTGTSPRISPSAFLGLRPELLTRLTQKMRFTARGTIVDDAGRPVGSARVFPESATKARFATTSRDGAFSLGGLPRGRNRLLVRAPGFEPAAGIVNLPKSGKIRIQIKRIGSARLRVRYWNVTLGNRQPYIGEIRVGITSRNGHRVEALDGTNTLEIKIPHGSVTIVNNVPGASDVTPTMKRLNVKQGELRTLDVEFRANTVIQNNEIQLLAFVCSRVPKSPKVTDGDGD